MAMSTASSRAPPRRSRSGRSTGRKRPPSPPPSSFLLLFVVLFVFGRASGVVASGPPSEGGDAAASDVEGREEIRPTLSVARSTGTGTESGRTSSLPILDGLFPRKSLDEAWESHPLFSTAYPARLEIVAPPASSSSSSSSSSSCRADEDDGDGGDSSTARCDVVPPSGATTKSNSIPTAFAAAAAADSPSSSSVLLDRVSNVRSILSLSDVETILSDPTLVHGTDFKLLKKVIRNGEEWNGMIPGENLSYDDVANALNRGGFSLVIDKLQRLWRSASRWSRTLEDATVPGYVSCNLYLTPAVSGGGGGGGQGKRVDPDRRSGFETHWDWMDVIVLQLYGEKAWSVAKGPIVYLSERDQKRKPTTEEMKSYMEVDDDENGGVRRYDEFLMRPGDALYVPRGYLHNASTIGPDVELAVSGNGEFDGSGGGEKRTRGKRWKWRKDGRRSDASGGDRADDGSPSLHLTFGIEHSCDTTFESLIHRALMGWAEAREAERKARDSSKEEQRTEADDDDDDDGVAVPKSICGSKEDARWSDVMHHALSEIARRGCGPSSFLEPKGSSSADNDDDDDPDSTTTAGGCRLRRSVPIHHAFKEIASGRTGSDDPVRSEHDASVDDLVRYASPSRTASFLRRTTESDGSSVPRCCYPHRYVPPERLPDPASVCPDQVEKLDVDSMTKALEAFRAYAVSNFDETMTRLVEDVSRLRRITRERDDADLKRRGR